MKHQETCYHPDLMPTQWNQTKPEPYTGDTCDCGKNFHCPVCGFGHGCYPCDRDHKRMKEANYHVGIDSGKGNSTSYGVELTNQMLLNSTMINMSML